MPPRKKPPCPICQSTRYRKDSTGFYVCENGHQAAFHRQEEDDREEGGGTAPPGGRVVRGHAVRRTRRGRGDETPTLTIPRALESEAAFIELEVLMLGVAQHADAMARWLGLRGDAVAQLRAVTLDLWQLYVTATGVPNCAPAHGADALQQADSAAGLSGRMLSQMAVEASASAAAADAAAQTALAHVGFSDLSSASSSASDESDDSGESDVDSGDADAPPWLYSGDEEDDRDDRDDEAVGRVGLRGPDGPGLASSILETERRTYRRPCRAFLAGAAVGHLSGASGGSDGRRESVAAAPLVDVVYALPLLAAWWFRHAVTPLEVHDAIGAQQLPWSGWLGSVPLFLRRRIGPRVLRYLRAARAVPSPKDIENAAQRHLHVLLVHFDVVFPALNWPVVAARWLSALQLPHEPLFGAVELLVASLHLRFRFVAEKGHYLAGFRRAVPRLSNFARLAGCIVFLLKALYGLDGRAGRSLPLRAPAEHPIAALCAEMPPLALWLRRMAAKFGNDALRLTDKRLVPIDWLYVSSARPLRDAHLDHLERLFRVRADSLASTSHDWLPSLLRVVSAGDTDGGTLDEASESGDSTVSDHLAESEESEDSLESPNLDNGENPPGSRYVVYDESDRIGALHRDYVLAVRCVSLATGVHEHDLYWAVRAFERLVFQVEGAAAKSGGNGVFAGYGRHRVQAHWRRRTPWRWEGP